MIKIHFLNVGQGDTIIIEWKKEGKIHYGFIDCNKTPQGNPALDFIIKNSIKELDFLFLSHPHYDHYSGFKDLINYCVSNRISIKHFLHTCERVPDFLESVKTSDEIDNELQELFTLIIGLSSNGTRENFIYAATDSSELLSGFGEITLSKKDGLYLKVLAPRRIELNKYATKVQYKWSEEDFNGNPNANWLSTLIKIYHKDWFILLTSDTSKTTFQDLLNSINVNQCQDFNGKLLVGQIPHHGSGNNYSKGFWKKISNGKNSGVVISVGENNYSHPNKSVIEHLQDLRLNIYSTNQVGSLQEHYDKLNLLNLALEPYSQIASTTSINNFQGDKIFRVDTSGNIAQA